MFTKFINQIDFPELILVGLPGERGLLSSAVESKHRNHRLTLVHDASTSSSIGRYSEKESHDFITSLIGYYADVTDTEQVIGKVSNTREVLWV